MNKSAVVIIAQIFLFHLLFEYTVQNKIIFPLFLQKFTFSNIINFSTFVHITHHKSSNF